MISLIALLVGCGGDTEPEVAIPEAECPDAEGARLPFTTTVEETRLSSECGQQLFGDQPRTIAGYVAESGCIAIAPEYGWARPFSDGGLAVVAASEVTDDPEGEVWARTHRFGAIDLEGEWVIEPTFLALTDFEDGVATGVVAKEGGGQKGVFVDKSGKQLGDAGCESEMSAVDLSDCDELSEGLAFHTPTLPLDQLSDILYPERLAALKEQGKQVFGEDYEDYEYEAVGRFVKPDGEVAIDAWFISASEFSGGRACAAPADGVTFGVIDEEGTFVVPAEYDHCQVFEDGSASVMKSGGPSKLVDASGETVLEAEQGVIGPVGNERVRVKFKEDGAWRTSFVDTAGERVIEAAYADAGDFSEGLAAVRDTRDGPWHFIGPDGATPEALKDISVVGVAPQNAADTWYENAPHFEHGLAHVITSTDPAEAGWLSFEGEWIRGPEPWGPGTTTRYRGQVCTSE